jgi:hypothetical protein
MMPDPSVHVARNGTSVHLDVIITFTSPEKWYP